MSSNPDRPLLLRFQRVLWAFEGLSAVLNPDQVLESHDRASLGYLIALIAEDLARTLADLLRKTDEAEQLFRDAGVWPDSAPDEEGGGHG
jgi:hypothetical protein